MRGINVQTVDNFQGEENDIIILSLVRNNPENNIGFLKISNRVNVALSRARWGLFIFGNSKCLRDGVKKLKAKQANKAPGDKDNSNLTGSIWLSVLEILNKRDAIIEKLEVKCETHQTTTSVVKAEDFMNKAPEGGCSKACGLRMECGHQCQSNCHPLIKTESDPSGHEKIKCFSKCVKPMACGHDCSFKCHECKIKHKPCQTRVTKVLPCGHSISRPCGEM
mmetsp:Transcript_39334/g.60124  ORF Transcript_39334/g.60124 Transcript_39334/m.60124 type:complete len:222 (-) Transcript_39334:1723-2388(-)